MYRFTSAAKLHRITDPIGKPAPVEGVSLEARLKAARRMRERALAEKAGVSGESREPERRGNFQFSLPP
ncbi:MAG: hypothetical protein ACE5FS_15360, partial [Paracoccaceae bacterium]